MLIFQLGQIYQYYHIYQPLQPGRIWHKEFNRFEFRVFPSTRLVTLPGLKKLVCPTILPIAGGRIIGFIPLPRVLVLCEMHSISSRIWTRVLVSISNDDNHYATGTTIKFINIIKGYLKLSFCPGLNLNSKYHPLFSLLNWNKKEK